MDKIQRLIDRTDDELEHAKIYAEEYIDRRAHEDLGLADRFKQMAIDALSHALTLSDVTAGEIDRITKIYTPPLEVENVWTMAGREYVEKSAWIRQMLEM